MKRVRLSRAAGWRIPANTVKVDRSTRWGNPFRPGEDGIETIDEAVRAYRRWLAKNPELERAARAELAGRNLACWCPLDGPCHADVLLELTARRERK